MDVSKMHCPFDALNALLTSVSLAAITSTKEDVFSSYQFVGWFVSRLAQKKHFFSLLLQSGKHHANYYYNYDTRQEDTKVLKGLKDLVINVMTTACGMIIMLCMSVKTQALLRKEISIGHNTL